MSAQHTASSKGSLFGEILDWMLAPLLLLWPMSVAITWLVAKSIANQAFDSALEKQLHLLQQQVQIVDAQFTLPPSALRNLSLADENDQRYAQFINRAAHSVEGDLDLPAPPEDEATQSGAVHLRTVLWHGNEVRIASLWLNNGVQNGVQIAPALLQIGETIKQRSKLANAIIRGVILPQFAILPIALFLVWLALARGLSPIAILQSKIRARQPDDLSPIANNHIPQEISPLVQSLNDMLARLEAAIAQQKRFIADAAHQMKTPLAGMQMQAELALRDAAHNNIEEVQRSLQQLARSSENATHLVNQLLSLARAENQGQAITAHVEVDLGLLAKQVITDWVATALSKQIDLGLEAPEGSKAPTAKLWILGNVMLLRELISNLLDNALRYTPAGGIVTLRLSRQEQQIVLEVEDNGPGIAEPERELVLQRFYRILDNQAQGSGLGLAIVREIAQQHHASLSLHAASSQPEENLHNELRDPKRPGCLVLIAFPAISAETAVAQAIQD